MLRGLVAIGIAMATCLSSDALAAGSACNPPAQRATWIAYLARDLHAYDPAHAAQMTEVVSEIIRGETAPLAARIRVGLDPDALLATSPHPELDMPLLTLAAAACQDAVARALVAAGASVNAADPPLGVAAAKGDVPLAAFLIDKGAHLDRVDLGGSTPLANAVDQGQLAMVELLLARGADPTGYGGTGMLERWAQSSDRRSGRLRTCSAGTSIRGAERVRAARSPDSGSRHCVESNREPRATAGERHGAMPDV